MRLRPLRQYRLSLRARATSWYVGLLAVALVVFSMGVYLGMRTFLKKSAQRVLNGTVQTISNDLLTKLSNKGDAWVIGELRESYAAGPTDHYIRLSTGSKILYQTSDMREPFVDLNGIALPRLSEVGAYHRQTVNREVVMIYSQPFHASDGRVLEVEAGTTLFSMQQTLHSLAKLLIVSTLIILIAATVGGYLLMTLSLRPLVVLAAKAQDIGRKELGERLPVIPTGDELERLTHSLNGMISRLEDSLNHNRRFSADASHELRTPLTIMRGEMEEMLQLEELPQTAVDNLVSTLEEIDRMSRIVNSLMTITRLDAGGELTDRRVLDLMGLVRTTVDHLRLLAEEKNITLTCTGDSILINAEPMRIKQVLVNLIDNAIKYTPDGGNGVVSVRVKAAGSTAQVEISDPGIGISPEALPYVFDRFYRADFARSRVAGGVGLGLAIVKSIVAAHEGTVFITSVVGQGSTVRVQLPVANPSSTTYVEDDSPVRKQSRYQKV